MSSVLISVVVTVVNWIVNFCATISPLTVKLVSVPTLVILGCAAPDTVVAVTALATKVAVLKLNAYPLVVAKLAVLALTALATNVAVLKLNAYPLVEAKPVAVPALTA